MDKLKNIAIVVLVLALAFLGGAKSGIFGAASGQSHYQMESFLQGVSAGARDQFSVSSAGVLTTSGAVNLSGAVGLSGVLSASAEGNKIGSANSYNPIYVGAGDGCTAILYAASTTLVSSATSTSFCN